MSLSEGGRKQSEGKPPGTGCRGEKVMQHWLESSRAGLRYWTSGKCGYETIDAIAHSFEETRRISLTTTKLVPTANPALCTLTPIRSQMDFTGHTKQPMTCSMYLFIYSPSISTVFLEMQKSSSNMCLVKRRLYCTQKLLRNENMYIQ